MVHPGGPFWVNRDLGAWSIPKGLYEEGEQPFEAARREFREETGFEAGDGVYLDLGELRQPTGKIIHAWAVAGNFDVTRLVSNTFPLEWPRGSGKVREYPEVDRAAWFELAVAARKIHLGQAGFLERLREAVGWRQAGLV